VPDHSSQTAVRLGFRAPGLRDRSEPAAELLLRIIDDGTSTRLYHRLCDDRGLCYDVSALFEAHDDVGLIELAADSSHEHAVEVTRELFEVCRQLKHDGPSAEEMEKARTRLRFQLETLLDSSADLAAFYGFGELFGLARSPEARLRELLAVTTRDVRAIARRLFRPERLALLTVGTLSAAERRKIVAATSVLDEP